MMKQVVLLITSVWLFTGVYGFVDTSQQRVAYAASASRSDIPINQIYTIDTSHMHTGMIMNRFAVTPYYTDESKLLWGGNGIFLNASLTNVIKWMYYCNSI